MFQVITNYFENRTDPDGEWLAPSPETTYSSSVDTDNIRFVIKLLKRNGVKRINRKFFVEPTSADPKIPLSFAASRDNVYWFAGKSPDYSVQVRVSYYPFRSAITNGYATSKLPLNEWRTRFCRDLKREADRIEKERKNWEAAR